MKSALSFIAAFGMALSAMASGSSYIPYKTNRVDLVLSNTCDGTWSDFNFQWSGYDDQLYKMYFDIGCPDAAQVRPAFRLTKPIEGTIYLEYDNTAAIAMSADGSGNMLLSLTIDHTNVPPPGIYYGEFLLYNVAATNSYRSVAQGAVNVTWSLYLNETNYFDALSKTNAQTGQVYIHPNWSAPPWITSTDQVFSSYATLNMHSGLSNWADLINAKVTNINGNTSNYQTAYSWGNHSTNGYITNYTETDPNWAGNSNAVVSNSSRGLTAYGWGNHANAGYLTTATSRFDSITIANLSNTTANLTALTDATYTGVVASSIGWTGADVVVRGKTYIYGLTKDNAYGTSTLSIAGNSFIATSAGTYTNYFTCTANSTNLVLVLDGEAASRPTVSTIFLKQATNGTANVAGNLYVGSNVYLGCTSTIWFPDNEYINALQVSRWNSASNNIRTISNSVDILNTNTPPLQSYLSSSNSLAIVLTNYAPLQSYLSSSNSLAIVLTNYAPLQSYLASSNSIAAISNDIGVISNAVDVLETNTAPLQSYLSSSNSLAIVLTNYAPLQSYLASSNAIATITNNLGAITNYAAMAVTNFDEVDSSTNYVVLSGRQLVGCVTNGGSGGDVLLNTTNVFTTTNSFAAIEINGADPGVYLNSIFRGASGQVVFWNKDIDGFNFTVDSTDSTLSQFAIKSNELHISAAINMNNWVITNLNYISLTNSQAFRAVITNATDLVFDPYVSNILHFAVEAEAHLNCYDSGGAFDSANHAYKPTIPGLYFLNVHVGKTVGVTSNSIFVAALIENGVKSIASSIQGTYLGGEPLIISTVIPITVTTNRYEVYFSNFGNGTNILLGASDYASWGGLTNTHTYFQGYRIY